jgi:hypothetical protein
MLKWLNIIIEKQIHHLQVKLSSHNSELYQIRKLFIGDLGEDSRKKSEGA